MGVKEEMNDALQKTWHRCNHLERFEAWADLYYRRFHRLSPGKSEAPEMYRDSNDEENRAQCREWHDSGLAALDAILEVVRLQKRVDELELLAAEGKEGR